MALGTSSDMTDILAQGLRTLGGQTGSLIASILERGTANGVNGEIPVGPAADAVKLEFMFSLKKIDGGLFLIVGRRGTGKTALSLFLAEFLNRPVKVIGIKQELLPDTWEEIQPKDMNSKLHDCVVVVDDSGLFFSSLDFHTEVSEAAHDLVDITRHKRVILILNIQRTSALDRTLVVDPDVIFFKPPSKLFQDGERDDIRRKMVIVEQRFGTMPKEEWPGWVYVLSDVYQGMLQVPLPSFWTHSLSTNKR